METVDLATSEVSALHGKVDRLKNVEAHNKATLSKFEVSFGTHVGTMQALVQQFSEQQTEAHTATITRIGKTVQTLSK